MPEVQLIFDYSCLDVDTRQYVQERAERIHNLARMTAAGIVQIGQYLTEVKARLKHGQFLEWIRREFAWSEDSAQRFMRVHEHFKNRNLRNLEIDVSALYLIAAQKTPEPVRMQTIARVENGEHVTHIGARELVRRFAETGEMPEITKPLAQMIRERREPAPRTDPETKRQAAEIRQRIEQNNVHIKAWMEIVEAIEKLNHATIPMFVVAREIRRFDTADVDWCGQARRAAEVLAELLEELKEYDAGTDLHARRSDRRSVKGNR